MAELLFAVFGGLWWLWAILLAIAEPIGVMTAVEMRRAMREYGTLTPWSESQAKIAEHRRKRGLPPLRHSPLYPP